MTRDRFSRSGSTDISLTLTGRGYRIELEKAACLAIPLNFNGPQPNFFGAREAAATPLAASGFIGDTQQCGSCNVAEIRLVPHCNGTHTESVGHIVDEPVPITQVLRETLFPAQLVTVTPCPGAQTPDSYRPTKQTDDLLITRTSLERELRYIPSERLRALVIRTLPNDDSKKNRHYGGLKSPPFFSMEAMDYLIGRGVQHLLVDLPSLDGMHDGGKLTAHHLFWNLPEASRKLTAETHTCKTVTEMIFVPNEVDDGLHLLDLQIPAFIGDAAPCRPIIYPLTPL